MAEEFSKKRGDVEFIVSRDKPEVTVTRTRKIPLAVMPITPFGKYNLIGKLGHGGMAEVFLAFVAGPAGFRKLCVIKRLHHQLEEEEGFLDMFLDEARLAARLNHPNIVQCFEVGDVDDAHFIAMEYLEGQGLDRIRRHCVRDGIAIPGRLVARMLIDALDGLHYAHLLKDFDATPLGVVHRDISPQNVFVTYDGVVKLLDFGIAKATTHVVETRTGTVKGKFAYMAPEQARGGELDHRADLWSTGVVLWETLSNRRLFKGPNDLATLNQSLLGEIPNIRDIAVGSSDALVRITHKALSREVRDRYQTAHEMKVDLEQSVSAEPGGLASRGEVAEFMRELFGEVIEQHRSVLQICLSDSATHVKNSSGRYQSAEGTPTDRPMTPAGSTATPSSLTSSPPSASVSGPMPTYRVSTPTSSQSALYPYAPPQQGSGWLGRLAILIGAVILAVLSTIVVLWLYGPQPAETIMVFNDPPGEEREPLQPNPPPPAVLTETPDDRPPATAGEGESQEPSVPEQAEEAETPPPEAQEPTPVRPPRLSKANSSRPNRGSGRPPSRHTGKSTSKTNPPPQKTSPPPTREVMSEAQPNGAQETTPGRRPVEDEFGYLTLDTMPWSRVSVGGRSLGITPVIRAKLPAGIHVVNLQNPEQGITTSYRVTIHSGQTTSKRLGLR